MTETNPSQQDFQDPVGSVGNQGRQDNVAGTVQGNQIGEVETLNQNQGIDASVSQSPDSTVINTQGNGNTVAGRDNRDINVEGRGTYIEGDQINLPAPPAPPTGTPSNLPRNVAATFVGRADELDQLHDQLQANQPVAISAIAGMGGIGKSELALQYAYRYAEQYPAGLCWLQARGTEIGAQVVSFGRGHLGLTLPDGIELNEQVAYCWSHWPEGAALIVVDDVTDYGAIEPFLPAAPRFKLLLTSRQRFGAPIQRLDLDVLDPDAALALLQSLVMDKRPQNEPESARRLTEWVGYLPLGIELIGRYLAEEEDLSLAEMQGLLERERLQQEALVERNELMRAELGVAAAFELSWQRLSQPAQQLGCLLALFAQAPIAWGLVEQASSALGFNGLSPARRQLRNLNLLQRQETGVYQLHPLLREFFDLKGQPRDDRQVLMAAVCQALVAVTKTVPKTPTLEQIAEIEPNLPHLEQVATALQAGLSDEDLIWPFTALGRFWKGRGAYAQAEPWWEQSLAVARERLGKDHPDTALSLNNLAILYESQGRYGEAEPLLTQALEIHRRVMGEDHPYRFQSLSNLAAFYRDQGRYGEAEPLLIQALEISRCGLGEDHSITASSLHNLAILYESQGRTGEAESLYQQALEIRRRGLGEDHLSTASSLNDLAILYESQGRYGEAEPLLIQALEIRRRVLGQDHPDTATSLSNLAALYRDQGRYGEAEPLLIQALEICRRGLGEDHPDTAQSLNNLARLYRDQGRYGEAELLLIQTLAILEQVFGPQHPNTVAVWGNLESLRQAMQGTE